MQPGRPEFPTGACNDTTPHHTTAHYSTLHYNTLLALHALTSTG